MARDLPTGSDFAVALRESLKAKDEEIARLTAELNAYRAAARTAAKIEGRPARTPKPRPAPKPRTEQGARAVGELRAMARDMSLGRGEVAVLTAVAQHGDAGVSREQLTVLTGYKRSSRDTYVQRLIANALVTRLGDGSLRATPEGVAKLGHGFKPLPTGAALLAHWMTRLPAGEKVVLDTIVAVYPGAVERDDISIRTGYKRSSRDTYIQRLRVRKLIEAAPFGGLRASAMLFDAKRGSAKRPVARPAPERCEGRRGDFACALEEDHEGPCRNEHGHSYRGSPL